jgi:hypothetical protein
VRRARRLGLLDRRGHRLGRAGSLLRDGQPERRVRHRLLAVGRGEELLQVRQDRRDLRQRRVANLLLRVDGRARVLQVRLRLEKRREEGGESLGSQALASEDDRRRQVLDDRGGDLGEEKNASSNGVLLVV